MVDFLESRANTSSNRVSATSKMSANGDTPISATVGFAVANGKVVMGVAGDDANAPKINSTVAFAIGTPATVAADRDLEFDLDPIALKVGEGERLRVDIASSAFPLFVPHTNTREPFYSARGTRVAHNTVFLDGCSLTVGFD